MVDPVIPTLDPQTRSRDASPAKSPANSTDTRTNSLLDSIARESSENEPETIDSAWKTAFTGVLWVGYTIAVIVAVGLVWSAVKDMLQ